MVTVSVVVVVVVVDDDDDENDSDGDQATSSQLSKLHVKSVCIYNNKHNLP